MELAVLIVVASLANAASQLSLKISARNLRSIRQERPKIILALFRSPALLFGIVLFSVSLSIYIYLISKNDVTIVFPAMGLTYVFVVLLSTKILNEKTNPLKTTGTAFIVIGLAMLAGGSE